MSEQRKKQYFCWL